MKRIHFIMRFVFVLFMLLLFTPGCYKLYDYINTHSGGDLKICNIEKMTIYQDFKPYGHDSIVARLTYNSLGDPVTMDITDVSTGNPTRFFRYDQLHRLSDYIGAYDNGEFEYWHRYSYDNTGRAFVDSEFIFGHMGDRPSGYAYTYLHYLSYDNKDRIVKDSAVISALNYTYVNTYIYDASGNKLGYSYDNKLNLHRTNKIWMFIDREYSMNNPFTMATYNSYNLPVAINQPTEFFGFYPYNAEIKYMCN